MLLLYRNYWYVKYIDSVSEWLLLTCCTYVTKLPPVSTANIKNTLTAVQSISTHL